jgi:hypothetical protein
MKKVNNSEPINISLLISCLDDLLKYVNKVKHCGIPDGQEHDLLSIICSVLSCAITAIKILDKEKSR